MLTATPVETYTDEVYTAREILLNDLASIEIQLQVAGVGVKTIRPFKRELTDPIVDDAITMITAATQASLRKQLPEIRQQVHTSAAGVLGPMTVAAVAAGGALLALTVALLR